MQSSLSLSLLAGYIIACILYQTLAGELCVCVCKTFSIIIRRPIPLFQRRGLEDFPLTDFTPIILYGWFIFSSIHLSISNLILC